ncbi:unnamed protein product [Paramecium sonneborni]|uniref:Uncharacterized protein n=1 Tax=Paramecium sonneborni TaxID=65129 RepID=A0A8S1RQF1_9CILI|nr:unnamed protein product [Paramecium sonneborni]
MFCENFSTALKSTVWLWIVHRIDVDVEIEIVKILLEQLLLNVNPKKLEDVQEFKFMNKLQIFVLVLKILKNFVFGLTIELAPDVNHLKLKFGYMYSMQKDNNAQQTDQIVFELLYILKQILIADLIQVRMELVTQILRLINRTIVQTLLFMDQY